MAATQSLVGSVMAAVGGVPEWRHQVYDRILLCGCGAGSSKIDGDDSEEEVDTSLHGQAHWRVITGDPASGVVYVLDREKGTWYSVDFEDEQFGGYSISQREMPASGTLSVPSSHNNPNGVAGA